MVKPKFFIYIFGAESQFVKVVEGVTIDIHKGNIFYWLRYQEKKSGGEEKSVTEDPNKFNPFQVQCPSFKLAGDFWALGKSSNKDNFIQIMARQSAYKKAKKKNRELNHDRKEEAHSCHLTLVDPNLLDPHNFSLSDSHQGANVESKN